MNKSLTLFAIVPAMLALTGCSRDVRLTDEKVRTVTVKAVSHYGEQLDKSASPEKVAYVALRAIREDFQAKSDADREAALDKQFDVCAADELQRVNKTGLSRDEWVYTIVHRWTPTVAHYVTDFPTSWEQAKSRLVNRKIESIVDHPDGGKRCEIAMEASDPSGDANARVVVLVWLALDNGFWRVTHLGFDPSHRSLGDKHAATTP
jgi:hypothetical protein